MEKKAIEDFKKSCQNLEIEMTDEKVNCFESYGDYLKEYNQNINLTAITDDEGILNKHFLDSIIVSKYFDFSDKKVIDIGSGAGFPGVALKILKNNIDLTLVDSVGKKVKFLDSLGLHLGLNYEAINKRAEDLGRQKEYRERYDVAVARAVKNLRQLSEYCLPLVKVGGFFLAMKGTNDIDEETKGAKDIIKELGGEICEDFRYQIPAVGDRAIILIKKISQTSPKYPRLTAKILKDNNDKKNKTRI